MADSNGNPGVLATYKMHLNHLYGLTQIGSAGSGFVGDTNEYVYPAEEQSSTEPFSVNAKNISFNNIDSPILTIAETSVTDHTSISVLETVKLHEGVNQLTESYFESAEIKDTATLSTSSDIYFDADIEIKGR